MQIAFFTDSYKPYISGVTNSTELLVLELRKLGHRVYVFAPYYPNQKNDELDVIRFPSVKTNYANFRLALPIIKDFPKVNIIHSHSPFQAGLLAKSLAKRQNIPIVYTFHTIFTKYVHYIKFMPKKFSRIAIICYLRNFCNNIDLILTPSKLAKKVLKKWKINSRCEIIPSGIDISRFLNNSKNKTTAKESLEIPEDAKVLLYVGRISKEKNIPFLIEAFKKLNNPSVFLMLVGGGPLLSKLKAKNIKNVIFTGEIPYENLPYFYCASDIFVFSSTTETQGLVLAEAKAAKLPIIALFAGGLLDTARPGIDSYLTARNIDSFIEHIKILLNDASLCEKMGENGFLDAEERFSVNQVAKRLESLYNLLVPKKEA